MLGSRGRPWGLSVSFLTFLESPRGPHSHAWKGGLKLGLVRPGRKKAPSRSRLFQAERRCGGRSPDPGSRQRPFWNPVPQWATVPEGGCSGHGPTSHSHRPRQTTQPPKAQTQTNGHRASNKHLTRESSGEEVALLPESFHEAEAASLNGCRASRSTLPSSPGPAQGAAAGGFIYKINTHTNATSGFLSSTRDPSRGSGCQCALSTSPSAQEPGKR